MPAGHFDRSQIVDLNRRPSGDTSASHSIEPNDLMAAVQELPMEEDRLAGRAATRGLPIGLEVTATPVNFDGTAPDEVRGESVKWTQVDTDDALPGFGDSASDGASGVVTVFSVVLIVVGVMLPVLPIIAALAALIWWILRRIQKAAKQTPPAS